MFVAGTHDYGTVDHFQQTSVSTRFFHIWFVPVFPLQSIVKSSLRPPFFVPLVVRSVVAGYARIWGPLLVGAMVLSWLGKEVPVVVAVPVGVLSAAIGVVGWMIGALDRRAYAERQAYRRAIGLPVDPAILTQGERTHMRAHLIETLGRDHGDYRGVASVPWERLTADPNLGVDALACVLTLARIDESIAQGAERSRMRSMRRRLVEVLIPKLGV